MPAEIAPIIHLTRNSAIIKTVSGSVTWPYSEPCSWSAVLNNTERLYGPSSNVSKVRENEGIYCRVHLADDDSEWESPDLIVEDYDYDTQTVTISGRCRLAELDREDQVIEWADGISTAENASCAALCTAIVGHCGLTITGAPTRNVRIFDLVGNPLELLRDLLEPTHVFRMGVGGQIVVTPSTSHPTSGALSDSDDLEILKFRRTTEIYNKATVERLEEGVGPVVLFDEAKSGGGEIWDESPSTVNGPHQLAFPSRNFTIEIAEGYRGELIGVRLLDEEGTQIVGPFTQEVYVSNVDVYAFTFLYKVRPEANEWGPFIGNWRVRIVGVPSGEELPLPVEGYSATATAGAGDRPYPEPYSSASIDSQADAQAAAEALVEQGIRVGNILNCATRARPSKVFVANSGVSVEDYDSEIDTTAVVEAGTLSWSESDTGTLTYECTIPEVA